MARHGLSQKCPQCCPSGGAVFRTDLAEVNGELVWTKVCQNCGYARKPRSPNKKSLLHTYDYVTVEATSDDGMNIRNQVYFHCFNPNGVYARLKEAHERINNWVAEHPERPNGVLLAHGSLNDFPRAQLFKGLDMLKRHCGRKALYGIDVCRREIKRTDEWLADPSRWPAPKVEA